jgi:hypothetical protein
MKARNIGWRLDYVLASEPVFAKVQGCVIQREFGTSDHGPVVATFTGFESSQAESGARRDERLLPANGLLFSARRATAQRTKITRVTKITKDVQVSSVVSLWSL